MFFVRSKGDTEGTRAEILKLDPQNRIRSMLEYVTLMSSSNLPELKPFIRTMVGLGIVISFLVVLLNMHTLVMERTREIGILKALGFSRLDVVKMLLGETVVLTIVGSLVGIGVTFLTEAILKQTNPSVSILLTPGWVVGSIGLALLGAAAGATIPALRASSYDPVEALAYE
jgi:putative ABC transport system permease protein